MGSTVEIRAGIDTETVRGLQLMNGGLAAALGAMLPNILTSSLTSLAAWMIVSIGFAAFGLVASVIHNRLRRKCSLQYDAGAHREPACRSALLQSFATVPGEPCICTWSIMWMWTSLGLFILALSATIAGASLSVGHVREPASQAACWDLKEIAGLAYRVNTCTGDIAVYRELTAQSPQTSNTGQKARLPQAPP